MFSYHGIPNRHILKSDITMSHCKMNGVNEMFFPEQKVIDSHDIHNNFDYIINFVKETPKKYNTICNNIDIKLKEYYEIISEIQYSL